MGGFVYALIEAMMAGLPVVATEVGGVPELVEDGVTGFLVPPRDPDALAEALQKLIANPELRRRMSQAGRKKALKEFTLDRMLQETEKGIYWDNKQVAWKLRRTYDPVVTLSGGEEDEAGILRCDRAG